MEKPIKDADSVRVIEVIETKSVTKGGTPDNLQKC